jgi:hypothetical protein
MTGKAEQRGEKVEPSFVPMDYLHITREESTRGVFLLLTSALFMQQGWPYPGILLSEKEISKMIHQLQSCLHALRQQSLDNE